MTFIVFSLNRPVRGVLDRREDMLAVGGRHAAVVKYRVTCLLNALNDTRVDVFGQKKIQCNTIHPRLLA